MRIGTCTHARLYIKTTKEKTGGAPHTKSYLSSPLSTQIHHVHVTETTKKECQEDAIACDIIYMLREGEKETQIKKNVIRRHICVCACVNEEAMRCGEN